MDYHLGEYSGIELLEAVEIKTLKAPAIMMTGVNDTTIDHQAMAIGVYDFLYKNKLDAQTIDLSIRYAIQHKQTLNNLYEIEQQKSLFVAMLSHDLKTPIYGEQKLLAHLLSEEYGPLTTMQKTFLNELSHSNRYLCHMINNLLLTYKYQDGEMRLDKSPVKIDQLCQHLILGSLSALSEEKEQLIRFDCPDKLPVLNMDAMEIKRVLTNLIQNAIQHSPKGATIRIEIRLLDTVIEVSVEDQGRGIPQDKLSELFKPFSSFQQLRSVGTGLGLYISKRIVEAHEGTIQVRSQVNQGSSFSFSLPV